MVSAATAGVLLAVVFTGIVLTSRASEFRAAHDLLMPALRMGQEEVRASPTNPDLGEVAASDPEITLAAFDKNGGLIASAGPLDIEPNIQVGRTRLPDGTSAVVVAGDTGGVHVVAALPWHSREAAIERLAIMLAALWGPLVGCAALASWIASRATFRPLADLAQQAEKMSEGSLSQRLRVSGEDEFSTFAARLNRFLDRLEDSVRRQEQFVGDAAHELRTPLAVLRGSIETTLRRARSEEEYRTVLITALSEAERLSTLVETLLQSATPKTDAAPVLDLEEAAEKAHARWVDRYSEAGVELELRSYPVLVCIQPSEIGVVLDNLLSNALRVSPPGSQCLISCFPRAGGFGTVVVEDEGPGIPEGMSERVFERFTRGDEGRSRDHGGFGIGLAVCSRLIAARGGTIRAENGDAGARFVIELPSARRESRPSDG
ncbi:sensor histidine kinase [Fimbriimonas ginsengisoli Gsoil 348]|uniref:histidine kinase n=2 Tax=Fimbriimonas ginsengisoli TaxID=1005039 RepID=A0A068NTX8_FIMGI|nr:sensor histidine kinase [Fimbriimonas ginsengisoli Gsoil 348]